MASALGPRGDGKGVEIAIQALQVAAVGVPAQHGVADEFPRAGEFFPASFPARIADREIEKFQGAREGLRAQVWVLIVPPARTGDFAPDIGQLFHQRQRQPAPCGQACMLVGHPVSH